MTSALLDFVLLLAGGVAFFVLWFVAQRYLPVQHWLRKWAAASVERRGWVESAQLVGAVLLMCVFVVLTIAYA
jgi:hypothetical protein